MMPQQQEDPDQLFGTYSNFQKFKPPQNKREFVESLINYFKNINQKKNFEVIERYLRNTTEECAYSPGNISYFPYIINKIFRVKYFIKPKNTGISNVLLNIFWVKPDTIIIHVNYLSKDIQPFLLNFLLFFDLSRVTNIIIYSGVSVLNEAQKKEKQLEQIYGQRIKSKEPRGLLSSFGTRLMYKTRPKSSGGHQVVYNIVLNHDRKNVSIQGIDSMKSIAVGHLAKHRDLEKKLLKLLFKQGFPRYRIEIKNTLHMNHQIISEKTCIHYALFYTIALAQGYSPNFIKGLFHQKGIVDQVIGEAGYLGHLTGKTLKDMWSGSGQEAGKQQTPLTRRQSDGFLVVGQQQQQRQRGKPLTTRQRGKPLTTRQRGKPLTRRQSDGFLVVGQQQHQRQRGTPKPTLDQNYFDHHIPLAGLQLQATGGGGGVGKQSPSFFSIPLDGRQSSSNQQQNGVFLNSGDLYQQRQSFSSIRPKKGGSKIIFDQQQGFQR